MHATQLCTATHLELKFRVSVVRSPEMIVRIPLARIRFVRAMLCFLRQYCLS